MLLNANLLCNLIALIRFFCFADNVQSRKSPKQPGKKTSTWKLRILEVLAIIFGAVGILIILYITRRRWCCIKACRGEGFLKNELREQIDAYMPGMRVDEDTGRTEYYEPTEEEMRALGSVLNTMREMAQP
ncbi:uncharacterized protein LOC129590194 [Paramacrobiotus metropolitanus]|uniref:uncharacterized protein LOC129590194 n=1 Tax=Paramacrobiotus metropolitanus TaxID=2943436 RepID=UPI0024461F2C|nr:uncharacterized protein LOC129590194 [Paramacrobiotus metropolitanus]